MASGVVTSIPMICFGFAARRLRLSTLGFIQYISPTIQFLLAVTLFGESVRGPQLGGYGLVWAALVIYSIDSLVATRAPAITEPRTK